MNKYEWIRQMSVDEMTQLMTNQHRKIARQALFQLEEGYEQKLKQDLLKEFKGNETSKEETMKTIKVVVPQIGSTVKLHVEAYKATEVYIEIVKYLIENYNNAQAWFIEDEVEE